MAFFMGICKLKESIACTLCSCLPQSNQSWSAAGEHTCLSHSDTGMPAKILGLPCILELDIMLRAEPKVPHTHSCHEKLHNLQVGVHFWYISGPAHKMERFFTPWSWLNPVGTMWNEQRTPEMYPTKAYPCKNYRKPWMLLKTEFQMTPTQTYLWNSM